MSGGSCTWGRLSAWDERGLYSGRCHWTDWLWNPEARVLDERDSVDELGRSRERFVRELGCAEEGKMGGSASVRSGQQSAHLPAMLR